MSNIDIDKIYGEEALKQVDLMNSKLAENVQQVDKITSSVSAMNKAFGTSTGGGGVKEQIKQVDILAKQTEKLTFVTSDQGKAVAMLNEQIRQANAENKIAAQYNLAVEGTYEKMDAKLKQLNLQYKRYVDLNKESSDSAKNLKAQIIALTDALKKDDAQRGITNRLVGDYKNQLHGLEVQIRKNVDAFNAMSAAEKKSTAGFTVRQEIMQGAKQYQLLANTVSSGSSEFLKFEDVIKKQPTALDKVSKGVGGVWSVIRQAAYLLPGVGLAGIMGFIFSGIEPVIANLGILNKQLDRTKELLNSSSNGFEKASSDINSMKQSIALAKEGLLDRTKVLKEYNDGLGQTMGKVNSLDEAERKMVEHGEAYIKMMILKTSAQLAYDESAKKLYEAALERNKKESTFEKEVLDASIANVRSQADYEAQQRRIEQGREARRKARIKEAQDEADIQKKIGDNLLKQAAEIAKANKFDYYGGEEDPKKEKPKEVNRIEILKKQYEDEILVQKKLFVDGTLSEQEFRYKQLEIIQDYATKRVTEIKNLSNAEKDTLRSLDNEWLDKTKSIADANTADQRKRLEELDKQVEGFVTAQDKELKAKADGYKEEARLREENAKDADFWFNWLEDQSDKQFASEQKRIQKKQQLNDAYWNGWVSTGRSANDIIDTIANAIYQRELTRLDNKDKALTKSYNDEIRFIEQSGYSQAEQTKMKAKLDAETEARRKQIDRDKITALRKQAQFNKILTISELTLETTIAVMRALTDKSVPNYYLRALNAVSAGVAGGAQIAKAAATQLPQYAKGRGKTGRAEFALVGEENGGSHEAILRGDGTLEVTPAKPTVTYLGPQDQVFSNKDFMQSIMNAAYIKLSNSGQQATTSALDAAVLDRLDSILLENQLLRQELIKKNFGSPSTDMSGFRNYKAQYIKQ